MVVLLMGSSHRAAPDFATVEGNLPILGGAHVTLSKDRIFYGGFNVIGGTGGDVPDALKMIQTLKPKLSLQGSFGYFVTPEKIDPKDRDAFISGTDLNVSVGPIAGGFSLDRGEPPAFIIGTPTGYGANVSNTQRLPAWAQVFKQ